MSHIPLQVRIIPQIPTSIEIIQTLKSLQKITPINIESTQFKSTLQQYSQEHLILYRSHNAQGKNSYVCFVKEQRIQDGYVNQLTSEVFKVEPLDGSITERKQNMAAKLDEQKLNALQSLHNKLTTYLNEHHSQPSAATCHFTLSNTSEIQFLTIGLSSKVNNLPNYYSGEWTSEWKFMSDRCEGKIHLRNHFTEGGNVIMERKKPVFVQFGNNNDDIIDLNKLNQEGMAQKIIAVIEKAQIDYQQQLQVIYTKTFSQALKKLRRVSPLTQGKMIWNLNAVLLSEQLHSQLPTSFFPTSD